MGVDETAQKKSFSQHVIVAGGEFTEDTAAADITEPDAGIVTDCAEAAADADIEAGPVHAGGSRLRRLRRLDHIGRIACRYQNNSARAAKQRRPESSEHVLTRPKGTDAD